ncbi:ABC transporter permease [Actinoallomurus spadix]|uniref:Exporter of polyketide antibiotics n=1 Tax=Actinoallomurus spadix TaxID=79912 RepID=A0ABP3GAK6_9ACTN|nr:ABC transporter permease [Actinoallomurus spadix]MCO5991513.1 ABC transporter permease [Actinoallomurus spadix]
MSGHLNGRLSAFAGTGRLVTLGLRRSRVMLVVWVYALTAYAASTAYGFKKLYDTPASLHDFVAGINGNGAAVAMYGRIHVTASIGGITAWRMAAIGGLLAGVMSVLLVVRHTRGDEEAGRLELVGAGVVGRRAPLTAGLLVGVIANLALAVLSFLALISIGLPVAGSLATGLAWTIPGLCAVAAAGVTAQVAETAQAARTLALAALGVAYLLRAIGDAGRVAWLTWVTPIGWAEQVRAFGGERWWLLALGPAVALVLVAVAYALVERRDLGGGLLAARTGPAEAAPYLNGPLGLAWRLQRGALLAWAAGFAVYGAAVGGILKGIGDLAKDSSDMQDMFARMGGRGSLEDSYTAAMMGIIGMLAAAYAVQVVLRMRTEETAQRLEPLLATRVRRVRWSIGHLLFAVAGPALLLAVAGLTAGLAHGLRVHDLGGQLPRLLGAALVQAPATWVAAAIAVLLFGAVPRLAAAAWGVLGAFLLLGQLGPVLRLSQAVMDLSPFTHVPKLPGGEATATPILALTAVAAVIAAAGLVSLRRRDIG